MIKSYIELRDEFYLDKVLCKIFKLMQSFVMKNTTNETFALGMFYDPEKKRLIATDNTRLAYIDLTEPLFDDILSLFGNEKLIVNYLPKQKALVYYKDDRFINCNRLIDIDISNHQITSLYLAPMYPVQEMPKFYIDTGIWINPDYLMAIKGFDWTVYYTEDKIAPVFFRCSVDGLWVIIQPMAGRYNKETN